MIALMVKISIFLIVFNQLILHGEGLRSNSARDFNSAKYDKGYKEPSQPKTYSGKSPGLPGQITRRGLGISAWGIVMVILCMIFVGMGAYYLSICYPILCQKQGKYDMIELASV